MSTQSEKNAAELPTPGALLERLERTPEVERSVLRGRGAIRDALHGRDPRLVAIVGPCSIHDAHSALEYARRPLRRARARARPRWGS